MKQHIQTPREASSRSKRSSVGSMGGDTAEGELLQADTASYARKRARLSNESDTVLPASRPVSPVIPTGNAATQVLFGSSPLTEPEEDFGEEQADSTEVDERLPLLVVLSQPDEREEIIFDTQDKVPVHQRQECNSHNGTDELRAALEGNVEQNTIGCDTSQPPVDQRESNIEDLKSGSDAVDAAKDVALVEASRSEIQEAGKETGHQEGTVNIDRGDRAMMEPTAKTEKNPAAEVDTSHVIGQAKVGVPEPDDEFDDEFDNDPWFDAACLKSFDALDAPTEPSSSSKGKQPPGMNAKPLAGSLFQTAGGSSLPEVAESAKTAARSLLSQVDESSTGHAASAAKLDEGLGVDSVPAESFIDTRPPEQVKQIDIPTVVGFSTGRGRKVDIMTTDAAAKNTRVAKLMQELMDIQNESVAPGNEQDIVDGNAEKRTPAKNLGTGSLTQTKMGGTAPAIVADSAFETPKKASSNLFTTAGGSQLGQISAFARSAVSSIFTDGEVAREVNVGRDGPTSNPLDESVTHATSGLYITTAETPATSSMPARRTGNVLPDAFEPKTLIHQETTDYPLLPSNTSVLSLGMPSVSFETPVKALPRHPPPEHPFIPSDMPTVSAIRTANLQDISNLQPLTPSQQNGSKRFKSPLPSDTTHHTSYVKPSQTPLLSRSRNLASPAPSARKGMSPALPRRVGLGMTPRTRSSLIERPKFISPFKGANADDLGGDVGSPNVKLRPTMRTIFSAPTLKKESPAPKELRHCFDLTCPTRRLTMVEAGLRPERIPASTLSGSGIPTEVNAITPTTAVYYTFLDDGIMKGPAEILKEFENDGLTHVNMEWIENHWKMILWKLASIVRAKPNMFYEKWNYPEVKGQLKYRYEREVNRAQRSAVKRIQEQDSPASLPMILCVSGIVISPLVPTSDGPTVREGYLELTDGWYTVRANIDPPLSRALTSGKLRVGSKIGISGAKLDASREGREVLHALNQSSLCITGNSTCLVEWHRRLGFTHKPFAATLRSLTPDGGNIPLVDVKVTKAFPVAYISTEKGKGASPWSVEEEFKLIDAWKERYMQEQSRLQAEHLQRMCGYEEDVERLRSFIEEVDLMTDAVPCEDEQLERYRAAPNKAQYIKALPASTVVSLYMRAQEEYQSESNAIQAEMEEQIRQRCPPRSTRSFQIIRVVDASPLQHEQLREAQLQVWDVKQLGDNMFHEGARYQVSNLVPAQQKAWKSFREKGEIYLSTTKATAWKRSSE